MNASLVYTVVAFAVFIIGWVIAYARGYRAGHDDGYTEAVLKTRTLEIRLAVQEYAHTVLGRSLSHTEADAIAVEFERWLRKWEEVQ
jgi:hypothetical protein